MDSTPRLDLAQGFPETPPFAAGRLAVGEGHEIAWWQSGAPDGLPVVFLHGGPGGGTQASARRSFDPARFRIVQFDQRGAGESTPHASVEANTTAHLVADMERLRAHLGVARWMVAGSSWGSTLALAYAQAHPDRVLALRLSGVFTFRRKEVAWWWEGIRTLFPERWADFAAHVPQAERGDLLAAYHRRLLDLDPAVHMPAAIALRTYSAWTQSFRPDPAHVTRLTEPRAALAVARLFTHYCANAGFMAEGALIAGVERIRHIPAAIVQARYDVVTPPVTAWELHQAWPEAALRFVNDANHVTTEPEMTAALCAAALALHRAVPDGVWR
jgi:proline iminopeptidase